MLHYCLHTQDDEISFWKVHGKIHGHLWESYFHIVSIRGSFLESASRLEVLDCMYSFHFWITWFWIRSSMLLNLTFCTRLRPFVFCEIPIFDHFQLTSDSLIEYKWWLLQMFSNIFIIKSLLLIHYGALTLYSTNWSSLLRSRVGKLWTCRSEYASRSPSLSGILHDIWIECAECLPDLPIYPGIGLCSDRLNSIWFPELTLLFWVGWKTGVKPTSVIFLL